MDNKEEELYKQKTRYWEIGEQNIRRELRKKLIRGLEKIGMKKRNWKKRRLKGRGRK